MFTADDVKIPITSIAETREPRGLKDIIVNPSAESVYRRMPVEESEQLALVWERHGIRFT